MQSLETSNKFPRINPGVFMAVSTEQQILIEQRVTNEAKSIGASYLLWFFVGYLGGHRFYLDRKGSAIVMLLLTIFGVILSVVGVGFILLAVVGIWALVDAFLIPGMVAEQKNKVRNNLLQQAMLSAN
ncbi:TM2 domain-containing protein [Rhizobium oryziradicis]|nr:TM2 domain-containing protein [Rhizobium oryziradicis]